MKRHFVTLISIFFLISIGCKEVPTGEGTDFFVHPAADFIQYQGRIGEEDGAKVLYWSGSSIKIQFKGEKMSVVLRDEKYDNYFNVLLDGELINILRPDTLKKSYVLVEDLKDETHVLEIFKRTEWEHGKTWFYGFEPETDTEFEMPFQKKRRMEFYGNSITAAYAVEDTSGKDSPDSTYTNFYQSYAAITARHFQANYNAIVRSGIGITVSWMPIIMPEIWDRLDPTDPGSRWDFRSIPNPDVVVVNLLQNDSWLILLEDFEQYKIRFGDKKPSIEFVTARYQDFIRNIRGKYPAAHIICMLGNMDITKEGSPWPKYVQSVVDALEDPKIHTLFVPHQAISSHPQIKEQEAMADSLINKITDKVGWK
ncbi:MAG: GDSL-type esterase/lipase family protein [Bacteroidia bacterium]|nr:GDSL-type esterase/lipase family protein [Bacteroidia bacterium]